MLPLPGGGTIAVGGWEIGAEVPVRRAPALQAGLAGGTWAWITRSVSTRHSENDRVAHILIVEDAKEVAELVHDHLVMAGYSVAVASDGPAGLRLLQAQPADLVILD